jgi:hypothetical protein
VWHAIPEHSEGNGQLVVEDLGATSTCLRNVENGACLRLPVVTC